MNVVLEGDPDALRAWGRAQAPGAVSCHEVLAAGSPAKARAFAEAALAVVHRALMLVATPAAVNPLESAYLTKHLHDAVPATIVSPWTELDDDCRGAVALEVAQRCRTVTFFRDVARPMAAPPRTTVTSADALRRYYHLVAFLEGIVLEDLANEPLQDEYLNKVRRLRSGLGLTTEDLAKLLRITRAAIHKWTQGKGVSLELRARIDEWLAVLTRLESYWRPGLLPSILRRHGRGLGGKRPLDVMLHGGVDRVLEYFDALTDYGATA